MRSILVVIDMQNDFITGALANDEALKILPLIKENIETKRQEGYEIAFTRDTHDENYLETQEGKLLPVKHCIKGTEGHKIASILDTTNAKVFDKPVFGSVELANYVEENKIEKVVLNGTCTDICVIANAITIRSMSPETEIVVEKDLCAGTAIQNHNTALEAMKILQVKVI